MLLKRENIGEAASSALGPEDQSSKGRLEVVMVVIKDRFIESHKETDSFLPPTINS
jgi:hypothetical protein